ncbi:phage tail protein [Pseudomonas gingeri]|uniref:phage tail protein n=1 Tax=Pseudomonas gingeri TaxID=117681 RepID=UPI0015A15E1A|nr:tail fiber protein [Pseudomonas gingeri]
MDYPKSVPSVGLVNGKFVDENPVNGSPGSLIPAVWGNAVTEELLNVVQAGGLQPSETARDQLLTAIRTIIQSSLPVEQVRTTLAAYGITDAYTKAEIEEKLKNTSALPVGVMVPFPKGTVPPGYLEVDGSVQSAATYPDLYAYLGTTFNTGSEPAGFFRLPESRGEFLRGWDHGRGVDVGRAIGSYQADDFKSHNHKLTFGANVGGGGNISGGTGFGSFSTAAIEASGGSETRPRNWSVMWCIKAWNAPTNQGNIDVAALAAQVQSVQRISVVGTYKALTASASGLNSLVSVAADQLVVGNEVSSKTLGTLNLSINASASGVNGLDTGILAASTWYYVWVIWNGSSVAGLLSLSSTTPTMPNGYTHKGLVSVIRTDASANKYPFSFQQAGPDWRYKPAPGSNLPSGTPQVSSGVAGNVSTPTFVAIAVGNYVPPIASAIDIHLALSAAGANVTAAPSAAYTNAFSTPLRVATGPLAANCLGGRMMLESNNIYWASNASDGAVYVNGFKLNL